MKILERIRNRRLIRRYPFLELPGGGCSCTWLDSMPEGWKKAFGGEMVEELREILLKASEIDGVDWLREYKVSDVKEKWGRLRWDAAWPECVDAEMREWSDKYEDLSWNTCVACGEKSDGRTTGWILPVCKSCAEKNGMPWVPFEERKDV